MHADVADSIIALADLAKAKLHALRANSFFMDFNLTVSIAKFLSCIINF
jgi:hypothetical protein